MADRLNCVPERIFNYISEHPCTPIRTMCADIRGRIRASDISYYKSIIEIMIGKGMIYPDGDGWRITEGTDFMRCFYAQSKTVNADDVLDYLVQMQGSTSAQIDNALEYDSVRGCYPTLLTLERKGLVTREKQTVNNREVWIWKPAESDIINKIE